MSIMLDRKEGHHRPTLRRKVRQAMRDVLKGIMCEYWYRCANVHVRRTAYRRTGVPIAIDGMYAGTF